jgi:hypothetical protein
VDWIKAGASLLVGSKILLYHVLPICPFHWFHHDDPGLRPNCSLGFITINYKIKPLFAATDKMYLFCVLFSHDMFRLIQVAIFR